MNLLRSILIALLLLQKIPLAAQTGNGFDSALHAAASTADDALRLSRLKALKEGRNDLTTTQAIALNEALLSTFSSLESDTGVLASRINLGMRFSDAGRYDEAIPHLLNALLLAEKIPDYSRQVRILMALGVVYVTMGEVTRSETDFAQAMAYYTKATKLSETHGIRDYESNILTDMAVVYDLQKNHKKAIALYEQAIVLSQQAGRPGDLLNLYINMGISLKNDRRFDAALDAYRKAIVLNDMPGSDPIVRVYINGNLATLYHEMGRDAESEAMALQVAQAAGAAGISSIRVDILGLLSRIYESQGKYREALELANQVMRLKAEMVNEEKAAQITDMQVKYEAGKKDKRIASQSEAIRASEQQNLLLWIGISLLAALGTVIYIGQLRARRLNRQIILQQAELFRQKDELQKVNGIKDRLFAVISHDLRTPVNSLLSFTLLLDNAHLSPDKLRQYTTALKQTLGTTTELLDNLLHFARTQMRSSKAVLKQVPIAEAADDAAQLLQASIALKNIRVTNNIPPGQLVLADPDMLAIILRNMLSNAVKFSHEGGTIHLFTILQNGFLRLLVKDEGTGMAAMLVNSFNNSALDPAMTYASASGTKLEKGTGLGLMLCKTFAALMNGSIKAESEEGKGTTFTLTLPV